MKVQCQDMQTHWQQEQTKIHSGTHTKSWDRQEDARIRPVHQNFEKCCLMKFCVQRSSTLFNIILLFLKLKKKSWNQCPCRHFFQSVKKSGGTILQLEWILRHENHQVKSASDQLAMLTMQGSLPKDHTYRYYHCTEVLSQVKLNY